MTTTAQGEGNNLENNKLIAEFMGGKITNEPDPFWPDDGTKNKWYASFEPGNNPRKSSKSGTKRQLWDLDYHTSWDWLMPVVEKIEKIPDTWVRIYGDEKYFECEIDDANYTNADGTGSRFHIRGKTKIDAVYQAVLEFINWYNSNPQTPK